MIRRSFLRIIASILSILASGAALFRVFRKGKTGAASGARLKSTNNHDIVVGTRQQTAP